MSLDRLRTILVALFAIGQFVTPVLFANSFGDAPPEDPIYFLPAGYAFAIWGIIIFGSAAYATYQLRPDQLERALHRDIGWWVMLNTVFFSLWLWAQNLSTTPTVENNNFWLLMTVIIIIGMLVSNIFVFIGIREHIANLTQLDKWLVQVPTAIYFGWLSVATIANTTPYLYAVSWFPNNIGIPMTIALLVVAALITGTVILLFNNPYGAVAYGAVIIWASIGIAVQNLTQSQSVVIASLIVAVVILFVTMFTVTTRMNYDSTSQDAISIQTT
ncbi:MAG: hypothetical protein AAFV98_21355 [Chloroflexota bacterium]